MGGCFGVLGVGGLGGVVSLEWGVVCVGFVGVGVWGGVVGGGGYGCGGVLEMLKRRR